MTAGWLEYDLSLFFFFISLTSFCVLAIAVRGGAPVRETGAGRIVVGLHHDLFHENHQANVGLAITLDQTSDQGIDRPRHRVVVRHLVKGRHRITFLVTAQAPVSLPTGNGQEYRALVAARNHIDQARVIGVLGPVHVELQVLAGAQVAQ